MIEQTASFLFNPQVPKEKHFRLDEPRTEFLTQIDLLDTNDEQNVVLFNPDTHERDEIVSFRINTPHVQVFDSNGERVDDVQISLIWKKVSKTGPDFFFQSYRPDPQIKTPVGSDFEEGHYELLFQASLPALTFRTFTIRRVEPDGALNEVLSKTTFFVKNLRQTDNKLVQQKIHER